MKPSKVSNESRPAFVRANQTWKRWTRGEDHLWRKLRRAGDPLHRGPKAVGARLLRVLFLAAMSFSINEVPMRAAALTFTTLLTFIPFVVFLSSVAGRLGYLNLMSKLVPYVAGSFNLDLPLDPVLHSLDRAQRLGFHHLSGWGTLGLLFGFFLSISNIEAGVNRVWNVRRVRSWWARFKIYTPFLMLLVALVVLSALLLLKARNAFKAWDFTGALPAFFPRGGFFIFGAAGVLLFMWLGLAMMIYALPNARVKAMPAWIGATVSTGVIYFLTRFLFLFPKVLLAQNRFLYGSLAIIPVLLLLIYFFWAAALFGAAVAFLQQRLYGPNQRQAVPPAAAVQAGPSGIREVVAFWDLLDQHRGALDCLEAAQSLRQPESRILELALPLKELGWIRQKTWGGKTYFRRRVDATQIDLMQLQTFLSQLETLGEGRWGAPNAFAEALHEVTALYAKEQGWPGISLAAVRGRDMAA